MSTPLTDRVEQVTQKEAKARASRQVRDSALARERALADFERQFEERWGVKLNNLAKLTPTLTGGEWRKQAHQGVSEKYEQFVIQKGKLVKQIFRRGVNGNHAFIDQLTFVFDKSSIPNLFAHDKTQARALKSDIDYIQDFNFWLYEIFGFFCSHNREKSANFYSSSYNLGDHENSYGIVCIGGGINPDNENTICVELTATGLNAAKEGWEERLYRWSTMQEVNGFKYTRVDIARDYLAGEITVDDILNMYKADGFTCSIQRPKLRLDGDDWYNDTQNGRTVYIGSRYSDKTFRAYEKGKQLNMPESPWVRLELEMRNRDTIIPLDIILYSGDYMATAYPCLFELFKTEAPKRVMIKERIIQRSVEHVIKYLRMQGSKAVNMLQDLGKSTEEIMSVFNPDAGIPKSVNPGQYFAQLLNIDFITHKLIHPPTDDVALEPSPIH